jgi:hypothetical protein
MNSQQVIHLTPTLIKFEVTKHPSWVYSKKGYFLSCDIWLGDREQLESQLRTTRLRALYNAGSGMKGGTRAAIAAGGG